MGEHPLRPMRVRPYERHAHPLRVEREQQCPRLRLFLRRGSVVEHTDEAAGMLAYVVLPLEADTRPELEVAPLPTQTPEHAAGAPVDLVSRPRVPRRDDQVPVRCDVD